MRQDSAWKEILETNFSEFLAFFFPGVHGAIDWRKGFEFLNQELRRLTPLGVQGGGAVDKLVKVYLRGGRTAWIFIHVEVQGYRRRNLEEDLFRYNVHIWERHRRHVVTLAILTKRVASYTPAVYCRSGLGCEVTFSFPYRRMAAFRGRRDRLLRSRNPFALVVLAHLEAEEARTGRGRLEAKLRLAGLLRGRGYNDMDRKGLLRFFDWLIELPPRLEVEFESKGPSKNNSVNPLICR